MTAAAREEGEMNESRKINEFSLARPGKLALRARPVLIPIRCQRINETEAELMSGAIDGWSRRQTQQEWTRACH